MMVGVFANGDLGSILYRVIPSVRAYLHALTQIDAYPHALGRMHVYPHTPKYMDTHLHTFASVVYS